jgi:ATP-dependent Lon protease
MKGNNQPPDKKDGSTPVENNIDVLNFLNSIEGFKYTDIKKNKKKKKNLNNQIKEDFENYNEFSPKKKVLKNNSSYNNLNELSNINNSVNNNPINEINNNSLKDKENIRKSKSYGMLEELVKQINNEKQLIRLDEINYNMNETKNNIIRKNKSVNSLVDLNEIENNINKINNKDKSTNQNKLNNKEKQNKNIKNKNNPIITTDKNKIDYTTIDTPFKSIGEQLIMEEINTKYKDKKKNTINQSMITKIRENFKGLVYEDYNQKPNLSDILTSTDIEKNLKLKIIKKYIRFISEEEVFSEEADKIKLEINNLIKIKNMKISNDYDELLNKVNNKIMPENLKIKLQEIYFRTLITDDNKLTMFLNNVLRLPYNKVDNSIDLISKPNIIHDDKIKFIKNIYEELNNNLFGLDEVKDSIVSFICQKINNPDLPNNKFLCLCGPAGVGKTSIVHTVSNALKIPYSYISMANIDESSILIGHSYTYEGSIPGCIAEALIKNDCTNGILLFDEIDKTKEKIQNILLGIFDPMQNYKFRDAYFGDFPINLSDSMMILCLNDLDKINPILRDRLHIINIPGYTISEKKIIIDTYIIPKLEKQYKLNINIDSKVIDYILEKTKIHKGIRQIIMNITKIYELCILDKFTNKYNFNNNFNYENISILKLNNDDFKSNMMYI